MSLYINGMIENTFVVDCFALVGAHQHDVNQINDSHGHNLTASDISHMIF